ncbi:MAG: hypothetical protein AB8B84_04005 [Granulosicoccus sp.]
MAVLLQRKNVSEHQVSAPNDCSPTLVTVAGAYDCSDARYFFEETRAYYSKPGLLNEVRVRLPDHDVFVEPPIVVGDPGFTLVARRKTLSC